VPLIRILGLYWRLNEFQVARPDDSHCVFKESGSPFWKSQASQFLETTAIDIFYQNIEEVLCLIDFARPFSKPQIKILKIPKS